MQRSPIKLLVVDDHAVVRIGLTELFRTVPRIVLVGEAGTAAEAVIRARREQPDVVLMDVRLPDESGIEACRQIRSENPETRVLMLTSYADEEAVLAAILAGAAGYLLKRSEPDRLIGAVELAASGGSVIDPMVAGSVLERVQLSHPDISGRARATLSNQESKILPLIAEGRTNREIAAELGLSENTVKSYVSNILQKLQLTRRSQAAAYVSRRTWETRT